MTGEGMQEVRLELGLGLDGKGSQGGGRGEGGKDGGSGKGGGGGEGGEGGKSGGGGEGGRGGQDGEGGEGGQSGEGGEGVYCLLQPVAKVLETLYPLHPLSKLLAIQDHTQNLEEQL